MGLQLVDKRFEDAYAVAVASYLEKNIVHRRDFMSKPDDSFFSEVLDDCLYYVSAVRVH